jgi:hypothetical protein
MYTWSYVDITPTRLYMCLVCNDYQCSYWKDELLPDMPFWDADPHAYMSVESKYCLELTLVGVEPIRVRLERDRPELFALAARAWGV